MFRLAQQTEAKRTHVEYIGTVRDGGCTIRGEGNAKHGPDTTTIAPGSSRNTEISVGCNKLEDPK